MKLRVPDTILERCAQAAHEMNRVYCLGIGDESQTDWESAPAWQRESAVDGVKGVYRGNGPEQSHESWLKEKLAAGWKYGPVKSPDKKEHPCMVPYANLPLEQRKKDEVFVSVVTTMAAALGWPVTGNYAVE